MIVGGSASPQPGDAEKCIAAGCDRFLAKPYSRADLGALLASLRLEPLYSTCADQPERRDALRKFVAELPTQLRAIEDAIVRQDATALRFICRGLSKEGGSHGFQVVSDAAAQLEEALMADKPLAALQANVSALMQLCLKARPGSKNTASAAQ